MARKGPIMQLFLSLFFIVLASCQINPSGSVVLSNDSPPGQCVTVGQVIGNASSRNHAKEEALEDLKMEARMISANYVKVLAVTAHGSAARGIAYQCR
jgi:hypothetical protein